MIANRWMEVQRRWLAGLWAMMANGYTWSDARWGREIRRSNRLFRLAGRGNPWHPRLGF